MKRVFLIVLDSLGVGASHDAHRFGDEGADTLFSVYKTGELNIPNLIRLGIGSIDGVGYLGGDECLGAVARLTEKSMGKDTTTGHWEIGGIITGEPMPTFPDGFPREMVSEFEKRIGIGTLCALPYSGTAVINDYGDEHLKTGKPIIYTSADSVFQIACHDSVADTDTLYRYCEIAREMLVGKWGVGRVIARPFTGDVGSFVRTADRRDFSIRPDERNLLTSICDAGLDVISVGKIKDIFAGVGITRSVVTHSNDEGQAAMLDLMHEDFSGLCFINLVDFDMKYGHRQDAVGYARALSSFDEALGQVVDALRPDDVLIITADHGCDPADDSTDHTRERVPLIIYGQRIKSGNLGTIDGFACIGKTICSLLSVKPNFEAGQNLCELILK